MISPTPDALAALHEHGLDAQMIEIALAIADEIEAAAEDVANDTRKESYDDSTSRGQLLYRRARNRTIGRFETNLEVSCDTTDNALHIRFKGTAFSFYSAREGLEHPSVQGSATKRRVVDESQLTLETGDETVVRRLVVMHESAPDGLVRLGVGVLANSTTWSWRVALYDRHAADDVAEADRARVSYDQLPEAELPALPPRASGEAERDDAGMTGGGFDPRRLTLARWVNELTKKELADRVGVSPTSITQYEAGKTLPSPAVVARLALACGVPPAYLLRAPDRRRPDFSSRSFFRSLRSTSQRERDRADALAEHVVDVVDHLDSKIALPQADVPSFSVGSGTREEIEEIAKATRAHWGVPLGPIANIVRLLESRGVIVARLRSDGRKLDAFSRWFGDRPVVILWADKTDKARSRFDAAHELGHLIMHSDADPLSSEQERQAHMFASAFLMPADAVRSDLVRFVPNLRTWEEVLSRRAYWGVSAKALLYRSREMGAMSEVAFRRSMQNYNRHEMRDHDGAALGQPEAPVLLARAASAAGLQPGDVAAVTYLQVALVEQALGVHAALPSPSRAALRGVGDAH